jgi:hypothetical protein
MSRKFAYFIAVTLLLCPSITLLGCASPAYMTTKRGTIRLGMTKAEVVAVWGEPRSKLVLLPDETTDDRREVWRYPRMTWLAAHGIDLGFSKDGILTSIEPLMT